MPDSWPTPGIDLHLEIDPTTGRRVGLEQALRAAVQAGRLAPDSKVPATRTLAAELGLSRGTVRAAYDQLIAEGYLTARQGAGTSVARLPRGERAPSRNWRERPPSHGTTCGPAVPMSPASRRRRGCGRPGGR